jgi:hypothetical protein
MRVRVAGRRPWVALALALAALPAIDAGADEPSKRHHSLFNPTPRSAMRAMSTDRPDTTESARTVDAGHVQVEMSFIDWVHDDHAGTTQSIASGGITYAVSDDWFLDCGATFGLSADADDVTAFAGTSFRF